MLRAFFIAVVITSLPSPLHASTSADTVLARKYLREAFVQCLKIEPETVDLTHSWNPPPGASLAGLRAWERLHDWLELVGLQWRSGDTLEATHTARDLLAWGKRRNGIVNGFEGDIRGPLIEKLASAHASLAVQVIEERAAQCDTTPDLKGETALALASAVGIEGGFSYLRKSLPDSLYNVYKGRMALRYADKADLEDIRIILKNVTRLEDRNAILNNFTNHRSRTHDWRTALAGCALLPDSHEIKPIVLARVAEEMGRSGPRTDAVALADSSLRMTRTHQNSQRFWLHRSSYEEIADAYAALGLSERIPTLLEEAPEDARRAIFLDMATATALAGQTDSALMLITLVQKAPQPFGFGNVDYGLPEWIEMLADSGRDEIAFRAVDKLRFGMNRGRARSLIASSQARRGQFVEALRTVGTVSQDPSGLANSLVVIAGAQATRGDIASALRTIDRIEPDTDAMCRRPIDYAPENCGHAIQCPPVYITFPARIAALKAVAGTPAGRKMAGDIARGRPPVEAAAILIGAASSLISSN